MYGNVGHHRILFSLAQYNVSHLKMFTRNFVKKKSLPIKNYNII